MHTHVETKSPSQSESREDKRALLHSRLKQRLSANEKKFRIEPRADREKGPLSFAQQSYWLLDQLDPGCPAYNLPYALRLSGPLDVAVLERSLQEIIRRHESLRTRFAVEEGAPLQIVMPAPDLPLDFADLSALAPAERDAKAHAIIAEDAARSFDLEAGPPFRYKLLRLDAETHIFLLTTHHIACDGWSYSVLFHELNVLYQAFAEGKPSQLPENKIQYADFAAWQRDFLQGPELEKHLDYWTGHLAGELGVIDLPSDRPRPSEQTFNGARYSFQLPLTLQKRLAELSKQHKATLFMTVLAAFNILMARAARQDDVIVGAPSAGRVAPEVESLIGCFVNVIVFRSDMSGNPTFSELLQRVRDTALETYRHQDMPFEKLVEVLKPARDPARTPLFQVMFQLNNAPRTAAQAAGLKIEDEDLFEVSAKLDLRLDLYETEKGLHGHVEYNRDLFDESSIARLMRIYETLLQGIVDDPERAIADYPLLTSDQRQQQLVAWNRSEADFPTGCCVQDIIGAMARERPEATALIHAGESLSYGELEARANRLAHHLIGHGVRAQEIVALCCEPGFELIVGMLAILKAGAAYVPLDPNYPDERQRFILEDTEARFLVVQPHLQGDLPANGAEIVSLQADTFASEPDVAPDVRPGDQDLAYVIYTSGSTGRPNGVMIPHGALANHMHWVLAAYGGDRDDHHLHNSSFCFDASLWEILAPLMSGASLVLPEADAARDPAQLTRLIRQHGVTSIQAVPTLLRKMLEDADLAACASLRHIYAGGEVLTRDLMEAVMTRLPWAQLHNTYGPTEATIDSTSWVCDLGSAGANPPIGRPIANATAYVLDAALNPVPVGVPGELYIGGAGLALGYLNRPELTAQRFIADPFNDGARLYKSGDLVRYRADGNIEFLGRVDQQVKIRGIRMELGEIETAMMAHDAVGEAVAIVREDVPGDLRLVLYFVATDDISSSDARAFLKQTLPEYMLPNHFVPLDSLPLLTSGKIDRKALPAPDQARPDPARELVAPRSITEEALERIWAEVLALDQVSMEDDFFELGGHSLLATQLTSRISGMFEIDLPLRHIFEAPTIEELATVVEDILLDELDAE